MVSKKFRLPVQTFPRQAKTIFKNGHLILKESPNGKGYNRVGVVFRRAKGIPPTKRNRLRRQIFDFFRLEGKFNERETKKGKDLLILLNPAIMNLTKEELSRLLKKHGSAVS